MANITKTRVLVMHSEHLIDAGLAVTLSRHADIEVLKPCTAEKIDAVLSWLIMQRPNILITDYERALSLSVALSRTQVASRPHLMVVTSRTTQAEIQAALKHGVAAYLINTSSTNEVADAVRNVQMGIRHVSQVLAKSLLANLLNEQLTPRETEVLRLAAQGFPNKVIALRLHIELGTIKCHMRAILDKLRAVNRTEAVVIAHQQGLLALAPDGSSVRTPALNQFPVCRPGPRPLESFYAEQNRFGGELIYARQ